MAEAANTRTTAGKAKTTAPAKTRQESQRPAAGGLSDDILNLQRTAGNHAVGELLTRAAQESAQHLDENVRVPMEQALGANLSGVRVHSGTPSHAAAESIGARAYTIGSDIYLGSDAQHLNAAERNALLAHEAVHTIQQGGRPIALQGKLNVSNPVDGSEVEADRIAEAILPTTSRKSSSLALRNSLRVSAMAPAIQRDIKGDKTWAHGKLEIDFKKKDATAAGTNAVEDGKITFTPSATCPESDSIRFVQLAKATDKSSGTETDFTWTGGEAARNSIRTKQDNPKNVASGFFIDQIHASQTPRTSKSDPTVLPYYDVTSPGTIGKRKGKTIVPATLSDTPGGPPPGRFLFVTSAKASDTGVYYGTVLWGFELFLDKAGVQKIKDEYHSFRSWRGETTDAALKNFNEFYKNPGTPGAPK
jgi:hypothetical protein